MLEIPSFRQVQLQRRERAVALAVSSRIMGLLKDDLPRWDGKKANHLLETIHTMTILAMRQERKNHASDMAMIEKVLDGQVSMMRMQPPSIVVDPSKING